MKALAGVVSAAFAILLVALGRRRATHVALGAFLTLIAANQFAEALRALTTDPLASDRLARLAAVFAAADPFALVYFASLFPERNRLNDARWLLLVAAPGVAVMAFVTLVQPNALTALPNHLAALLLTAYTALAYALVLWHAFRVRSRVRAGAFLSAVMVVALPVFARLGEPLSAVLALDLGVLSTQPYADLAVRVGALALAVAAGVAYARRAGVPWRDLRAPLAWGLGVSFALLAPQALVSMDPSLIERPWLLAAGRAGNSVRWLCFGALMSVAVVRDGVLGFSARDRRRAARVVIGLGLLAMTAWVLDFASLRFGVVEAVALALVLVLTQGFRNLVDRVSDALYALPPAPVALGPDEPLRPGAVLEGRYAVERLLAVGGSARVFLARDEARGDAVALKEVPVDPSVSSRVAAEEARIAGLLGHANVVAVRAVLERPGACVLACEYLPGGTLSGRVERDGPLDAAEAVPLVAQVLDGLAHVHARGIVHRDVKPSNVLFAADGAAKLGDFGVARLARDEPTRVPGAVGTPAFMAPEQLRGEPATPAADVHAVGLLVRRCVRAPLPPALEGVVSRALRESPLERWPDAGAMLAAWRQAGGLQ